MVASARQLTDEQKPRAQTCTVEGCERAVVQNGQCAKHNSRDWHRTHPGYGTWRGMIERCTNPNHRDYAIYGGRGINVTPRWRSYSNFLADMGPRPSGMSLDRIEVNGNYEPGNCRWATPTEQAANQRKRKPKTYWSRLTPQCLMCGQTSRKHEGNGLCTACFQRERRRLRKVAA